MRFIVDAQLPPSWANILKEAGHEAMHTRELPDGNDTSDSFIIEMATTQGWVVITKDTDFLYSFLTTGRPPRLVLVRLGNMRLRNINMALSNNVNLLIDCLNEGSLIELWPDEIRIVY
ncbi:MAG: DUF5615 family PIN-like protein [Bacteroidia bacterium]